MKNKTMTATIQDSTVLDDGQTFEESKAFVSLHTHVHSKVVTFIQRSEHNFYIMWPEVWKTPRIGTCWSVYAATGMK